MSTSGSDPGVIIHHCLCAQVIAGTTTSIEKLPKRQSDGTLIATSGNFGSESKPVLSVQGLTTDQTAVVIRLDDGFEKRYPARCDRCGLMAGYRLDKSQTTGKEQSTGPDDSVLYILPGGLMTTEDLEAGKDMSKHVEAIGAH
jgi:hypothetical protein